jgi:deazaflavin-dependent oxidoreductase (nitroreductase family)
MKRLAAALAGAGAILGGVLWWRRHPRAGAAWVNRVANPWQVRRGGAVLGRGEIGLLEHVGRRTGTVRVTPVHPVRTNEGFRIIVPLGDESQWAQNVLAAGHCRLQVSGEVHELDEPRFLRPRFVETVPAVLAGSLEWLGFRYLVLRSFTARAGTLESKPQVTDESAAVVAEPPEAFVFAPRPVPVPVPVPVRRERVRARRPRREGASGAGTDTSAASPGA